MKMPYIIAAAIAFSSSIFATPFDQNDPGRKCVYVSIKDQNHNDILTDRDNLSYKEFQKYNTRYVKTKPSDRYIYEIENYGISNNKILGAMKIIRSKDDKVMAEYYFSGDIVIPPSSKSRYEIEENKSTKGRTTTKVNLISPDFPHRVIKCLPKNGGDEIEWLIFYPGWIGKSIDDEAKAKMSGGWSMVLYCPKSGFIDLVGTDRFKNLQIPQQEFEQFRSKHPMNK